MDAQIAEWPSLNGPTELTDVPPKLGAAYPNFRGPAVWSPHLRPALPSHGRKPRTTCAPGIFYARSTDGSSFNRSVPLLTGEGLPAAHPAVLTSAKGALVAINLDTNGARALSVARVDENQRVERYVVPRSDGSDHPQWAALPARAVLAWTEKTSAWGPDPYGFGGELG